MSDEPQRTVIAAVSTDQTVQSASKKVCSLLKAHRSPLTAHRSSLKNKTTSLTGSSGRRLLNLQLRC
jgi:hypothetical protein